MATMAIMIGIQASGKSSFCKGIAEIITARNKYGSRGVVKLAWIPEYQKFCNLEKLGG